MPPITQNQISVLVLFLFLIFFFFLLLLLFILRLNNAINLINFFDMEMMDWLRMAMYELSLPFAVCALWNLCDSFICIDSMHDTHRQTGLHRVECRHKYHLCVSVFFSSLYFFYECQMFCVTDCICYWR